MILDTIVKQKKRRLMKEMSRITLDGWKEKLRRINIRQTENFYNAIKGNDDISIIGEVKKASPSKGIIKEDFNPVSIAKEYYAAGAKAVSVLTEKDYFLGNNNYLVNVRQTIPIPVLRKDFIIELWQVYESRFLGADAILLIASILPDEALKKFLVVAKILGMECIVEVHTREEVERALHCGAGIIGINNRDLQTFEVNLKTTGELINYIPHDRVVISESGINTGKDIQYLREIGVDGVLIGETFMRSSSITAKMDELCGKKARVNKIE